MSGRQTDYTEVDLLKRHLAKCMGDRLRLINLLERISEPGDDLRTVRRLAREALKY